MKFQSSSGDIITIHGDQRLACECYISSLQPKEPALVTNIEQHPSACLTLAREDLDPTICYDSHIKLVEDTQPMTISPGKGLKLGVDLSHSHQALI